jgi:hypothetical protein
MKKVTTYLQNQDTDVQSLKFPDACCYCGKPVFDTVEAAFGVTKVNIPYCDDHHAPAKEYVTNVFPRYIRLRVILAMVMAIAFAIAAPVVFNPSSIALQIVTGVVGFVFGFIFVHLGGGDILVRSPLGRGAKKLGFSGTACFAPGLIYAVSREEVGSARVLVEMTFADDSYADQFTIIQQRNEE